jgi:hypothetical protein
MTITLRRILIDENGSARVYYTRDDGPSGAASAELAGTPELAALLATLSAAVTAKISETQAQQEAARAERLRQIAASRQP